ncbi:hypothetical protein AGMMS50239_02400 [Bacteroidia bacterium]|nr:hypothetical protein AGMMS50239_02400 [Bacteroidia bacterium]
MKTKYLLTLLWAGLVFPLLSIAQTSSYRSYFGKEFTHWYVVNEMIDLARHSERYSEYNQDTLLNNGICYKKAYIFYSLEQINSANLYYRFGIREEIETGSLFIALDDIYETTDEVSEVLVSKMDLEIGDKYYFPPDITSINEPHCWQCFQDVQRDEKGYFATVDSIYYKDNRKYIRLDANYSAFYRQIIPLTFIEGIGPNVSFAPLINHFSMAVCCNCYEDETGVWKSEIKTEYIDFSEIEECFFEATGIPKIEADFPFKLIQQKGKIEIRLNGIDLKSGVASIYSIDGRQIASKAFRNKSSVDFTTAAFSQSVYIIQIRDTETGRAWSKKINNTLKLK